MGTEICEVARRWRVVRFCGVSISIALVCGVNVVFWSALHECESGDVTPWLDLKCTGWLIAV